MTVPLPHSSGNICQDVMEGASLGARWCPTFGFVIKLQPVDRSSRLDL